MPVTETSTNAIVNSMAPVALSNTFTVTGSANPAYLIVCALDRDEYTVGATHQTGSFAANNATQALGYVGGDGRGSGIVYTWQASTGQYVNATFGTLSQLTYVPSASRNDVTSISMFTTASLGQAQSVAGNAYALIQSPGVTYAGSATIVTDPGYAAPSSGISGQPGATPASIALAAARFVGMAWNMDGCWVLASTIAAEAGASLPVQSTEIGVPGQANGEWFVLYDGPASAAAGWQGLIGTGDVISFCTASGSGHITTCVRGAGGTAQLIDNITYETQGGVITNAAHDGSAQDILVSAAHPASQEWAGVNASSVVIYALDCPAVSAIATTGNVLAGSKTMLSTLAKAADPNHRAITQYQLYDTLTGASFAIPGSTAALTASSAKPLTVTSLATVSVCYPLPGSDTLDIRASNGSYWGDWQAVTVTVLVPVPVAPKLTAQTANQTWQQGAPIALVLPSTVFTDPQHQVLTYSATQAGGAALPGWLSFDPAARAFSGTVPKGAAGAIAVVVTATDTAGLSASEKFTVTIPAAPPVLAIQTPAQVWAAGSQVSTIIKPGTFADPQGQALTLKATLATGAALPSWLSFSPSSGAFSGSAPKTVQTLALKLSATDTSGLTASETFSASITAATGHLMLATDWPALDFPAAPGSIPSAVGGWAGSLPDSALAPAAFWHPHHPIACHL